MLNDLDRALEHETRQGWNLDCATKLYIIHGEVRVKEHCWCNGVMMNHIVGFRHEFNLKH